MTTVTMHPLAEDYLDRLDRAGRRLPRRRRAELVAEIETHLTEAIGPGATDAEVLTVLDRLGEPADIIDAEQPASDAVADRRGFHEWAAIFLLLFGGFFAGVGWLVGMILLLSSRAWTTTDKWLGALVVPGGLALPVFLLAVAGTASGQSCSGGVGGPVHCTGSAAGSGVQLLGLAGIVALTVAPIVTAVYLARRAV